MYWVPGTHKEQLGTDPQSLDCHQLAVTRMILLKYRGISNNKITLTLVKKIGKDDTSSVLVCNMEEREYF